MSDEPDAIMGQLQVDSLQSKIALLHGALAAQVEREGRAGERCGIDQELHGCDWPDAVAEEVLVLRQQLAKARRERAEIAEQQITTLTKALEKSKMTSDAAGRLHQIKEQLAEEWRVKTQHGIHHDHLSDLAFLIASLEFAESRIEAALVAVRREWREPECEIHPSMRRADCGCAARGER